MKVHDEIRAEIQAKLKYHYRCIDELNDRMNRIQEIKNLTVKLLSLSGGQ